jgi:uncharacterized protein (TIGR04255 family)
MACRNVEGQTLAWQAAPYQLKGQDMAINEVFPNPTVKQVIFQIRFPNLFYMESRIGDYQLKIMSDFPESSLLHRREVLIANLPAEMKNINIKDDDEHLKVKKVWRFKSPDGITLNVNTDSLDISSTVHKTYNNQKEERRFRDVIEKTVGGFLEVTEIPIITRLGLRYVDECPVPNMENGPFREHYETTFPLERFPLEDVIQLEFKSQVRRDGHFLLFKEVLVTKDEKPKYVLDFDGYAENIKAEDYLKTSDDLHLLIWDEYKSALKEPVFEYMRKPKDV